MVPAPWSELQADALREVGNIGCGRAVAALSRMLGGRRVLSEVPQIPGDGAGRLRGTRRQRRRSDLDRTLHAER